MLGGMVSEEVDLIVVKDHHVSEQICEVLKRAGIHHVEFWPEDMLDPSIGLVGRGISEPPGVFRTRAKEPQGPFHIRVREEDLAQAQLILTSSGLASDQSPGA
jgi:hypothetical protein